MIRPEQDYLASIAQRRDVFIDGERVSNITQRPAFKPTIDIRARIYDMQHESAAQDTMTVTRNGERDAATNAFPLTRDGPLDFICFVADLSDHHVPGQNRKTGDATINHYYSLSNET